MIDVKAAVRAAAEEAKQLLGSNEVLLEEVERSVEDDREVWLITLSVPRRSQGPENLGSMLSSLYTTREYKIFSIDAETGAVIKMKIRQLAGAR